MRLRGAALVALLLPLSFACGDDSSSTTPTTRLEAGGHVLSISESGDSFELLRGDTPLLRFDTDAFQLGVVRRLDDSLSYDPFWIVDTESPLAVAPPEDLVWNTARSARLVSADSTEADIELSFADGFTASLHFESVGDGHFTAEWKPAEPPAGAIAYMRLRANADSAEGFYGLGEWMDDVDHRGHLRPMQLTADLRFDNGTIENHIPIPLIIGTRGWGLFVENIRAGLFDVATQADDLIEVTYGTAESSVSEGLRFHLYGAEHPLDITQLYYETTGYPAKPARWAYGPLIWRDENRDQAEVEDDIRTMRALDLATSGIWIDRPYATAVNTFDFKPEDYPDPQAMIDFAHDQGLRVALWHTPYVVSTATALRSVADDNGYFPPEVGATFNNWSEPIDFTNPEAQAWWQGLIQRYRDMGIEGFKLDFAEDVSVVGISGGRTRWRFSDGSTERTMHHRYTVLYHETYAEMLPADGGFLLCRAGKWGDQKNVSVVWPSDLVADFDEHRDRREGGGLSVGGLPASIVAGLSLGPSGFPFFGADTGGYIDSPPDEEVYIRWFQQTALSSVMQVGDSSSQPPWVFTPENGRDDDTVDLYREYARLHLRLFPYVWSYAERLDDDGRPITRALGLAHPELGVHPNDTYLLGDHLLVAPVVKRGQTERSVTFPEGTWVHWFTDETFDGGQSFMVDAPLDRLALFVRAGAIVPLLRPTIDTLSPTTASPEDVDSYANDPGRLYARTTPGPAQTFTLFDGGVLDQTSDGSRMTLRFSPGDELDQGVELEVRGLARKPSAVGTLEEQASREGLDAAAEGWWWDGDAAHVRFVSGEVVLSR